MFSVAQVNKNLKDMITELKTVRGSAQYLLSKISKEDPSEFMGAGEGQEMPQEDSQALAPGMEGGEPEMGGEMGGEEGGEFGKEKEEKHPAVKTPEEAKKVVNEAITDLKSVVDGIDNISDQATDMEEKTSSQTFRLSSKVSSEVGVLTNQAIGAIEDARGAVSHWAFLLKKRTKLASSGNSFVENVREGVKVWRELGSVLATAVPPTGSQDSGDKTLGKNPAKVEVDEFHKSNEKFKTNKAKEDKLPNPSIDNRLTDAGNPHELGANVAAKSVKKPSVFSSAVVIRSLNNEGKGKFAVATWENLSDALGEKSEKNYNIFMSPSFAKNIESHVKKNGIDAVAAYLNAEVGTIGLQSTAREPKVEDKAKLRAYYDDAFGDKEFARDLTSNKKTSTDLAMGINQDKAGAVAKGGDDMNVGYKPEIESANDMEGGLDGGRKDESLGKGNAPVKDASIEARQAKARRAVDFARLAASRGLVKYTKLAIAEKAREVVAFSDDKFNAQKELLMSMPEVNASALKESRIPDNEEVDDGIVGNTATAVRNPKGQVTTESLDSTVKSDAKITESQKSAARAAVVPQLQVASSLTKESFVHNLSTLENRLAAKGINLDDSLRRVRPHYKKK